MNDKYKGLTQNKFQSILANIIHDMSADEILSIPNVSVILAEELNNAVLDEFERIEELKK